jgi:iron complex transport system substrate-binding protein
MPFPPCSFRSARTYNRVVSLDHAPRRIVSLQPSATVILAAIGELGRVVACTKYCSDVVPEVADSGRTIVADSWTASADEIVSTHPDLVIAAVPYQEKAVSEILRAGIRFLGLAPKMLADIYSDIAAIAGMVAAGDRGEQIIASMQERIEGIRERTSSLLRPRVYCEEWGKPLIASQKWVAELVDAAGGKFIAEPGKQITDEAVADLDPEVIIAAWCGAGDRVPLEKIIAGRGWQKTSAARADRVFCIRDELLNTPAPTILSGLDALAHAIHPDLYPSTKGIRRITTVPSSLLADSRA